MKINRDKEIKLNKIPDNFNEFSIKAEKLVDDAFKNYKIIYYDALNILNLSLNNNISKPLIMYNFIFFVEIALKFYLSKFLSIDKFENKRHDIYQLVDMANNQENSVNFEELKEMLKKFKNKNNQNLEYKVYYNYKYNHKIGEQELIFDYNINEKDKNRIEEVVEWIKNHILS